MKISIETTVNATIEAVWGAWITPEDITQWNFASDDWICPKAEIELKIGDSFCSRMEAKDGSKGFDFCGTFSIIEEPNKIEYVLEDDRKVLITFSETEHGIKLVETFDAEDENSAELQKKGWQSILINFKQYVESQ